MITQGQFARYMRRWVAFKNAGLGGPVGFEEDDPAQAIENNGDDLIACEHVAGELVAIGEERTREGLTRRYVVAGKGSNGRGPWAVWLERGQ